MSTYVFLEYHPNTSTSARNFTGTLIRAFLVLLHTL